MNPLDKAYAALKKFCIFDLSFAVYAKSSCCLPAIEQKI